MPATESEREARPRTGDSDVGDGTARRADGTVEFHNCENAAMTEMLLPTTVVGSYPQPDWLIDRDKLTTLPPVRGQSDGERRAWRCPADCCRVPHASGPQLAFWSTLSPILLITLVPRVDADVALATLLIDIAPAGLPRIRQKV